MAELRPKYSGGNVWVFDGKELRPKYNYSDKDVWVFDGSELRPKYNYSDKDVWEVTGSIPVPVCALVILGLI